MSSNLTLGIKMPIHRTVNVDFFKKWTPEMAYILGFFTADGSMLKNKRGAHFIEFNTIDKELLEGIKNALASNHKLSVRKRSDKWQISYRLQIGSKNIFNDLLRLGLMPRKSRRIRLPRVPRKYFSHFVRGYFDGDGNVWTGFQHKNDRIRTTKTILARFTSGSKNFLTELSARLSNEIKTSQNLSILFYSGAYRLSYSVQDSIRLYNFIYPDTAKLYLARKRKIFEKYFKIK